MDVPRRRFLLATAAAAAQTALGQNAAKVKTAVIGTGNRGSYLLQGVLEQPDAEVAAVCDIKPDRLDKAATAAKRDNPKTYTDWKQIVDRKDIDAVYIATPPHLHSEMAVAALKSGKHVYCEKPVGVTAAQVKAVVEAARGSNKIFTAGQQLRSQRLLALAVKQIHDGIIGDILMVKAQRHATADLPHDGSSGDWYFDVTKSGGYLIEQSVHNLDLCNWVIGGHPLRAMGLGGIAQYKNDPPGRTIYDNGHIVLRLRQRRPHVVHAERLPPAHNAERQSVRIRVRVKGRSRPDGKPGDVLPRRPIRPAEAARREGARTTSMSTS